MNLYLDIETIPSQAPEAHAALAEKITAPGNYKKPESIAQWEAEQKPALVKEAIAKTALDGSTGHICCIGWAFDGNPSHVEWAHPDNEDTLLAVFFNACSARVNEARNLIPTIVGHNVVAFDIRFIWQRAIVLGVRVPNWFPRQPKPWSSEVFDTMTAWAGPRDTISLDRLATALGLGGKDGMDGSMVAGMWQEGRYDEIASYCRQDIELTRAIHKRMCFAYGEAA